jgi:Pyruvate/2-oxoacid:ferredoxin oxidoreductase gamma subunit
VRNPLVLAAFNAPNLIKLGPTVAEGGIVIYDSSVISETPEFGPGVSVHPVPCSEIAHSLGYRIVKNVVALGALQAASGVLEEESLLTAIRLSLQDKCSMITVNEEAFHQGVKAVGESS